ncbi:thiamine pyrophosphate-dependent enzyme [Spiroplasma platyhelix]|uniref:2-oxoisovalerate dehydrogenase subunit alpha n=1 Tax=Spiroplasma platyhelix PALS-1 TaxID=1276218 RepID=A0A846U906_9MOLU|nr:thiamine pyrophosphate-dependent enzyme [Spiroplasma platyhelix]MBE4703990.1 Pyruvate dehydrogenase E1 component subunit alpha [Spiroplasma platyhelix PALS-1]NKE38363.1 pyruvate dehydrogenase (acetyl-transferring) E1 component subunit alpha [Spiroplasma platyhelix PALS-1]UJB29248.1 pyruvate dehydrogenase E1 component subunit alpha [Spiroplasma platyhelix PALS-1]
MWIEKFDNPQKEVFQILNEKQEVNPDYADYLKKFDAKILLQAYQWMTLSRLQEKMQLEMNYAKDDKGQPILINGQPKVMGKVINFLGSSGQEATEVGYAINIRKGIDWLVPAYRNNAAWITAGYPIEKIIQYWLGNEMGSQIPKGINILPVNIPIGTQYSHAAGIALAEKYKKGKGVIFTTIGDGGTSEGEFFEAMNFAALHKLPIVFFIENNQWSLDTPTTKATMSPTFAQKGTAVGIPNIRVDGNDFFSVYHVTNTAIERAKNHQGPSLIEAVTYRQLSHSAFDIKKDYFTEEDFKNEQEWFKKDPIIRMKTYLEKNKLWDEAKEKELVSANTKKINEAIAWAQKNSAVPIDEIFDYTYEKLTPKLAEQKAEAKSYFTTSDNLISEMQKPTIEAKSYFGDREEAK